MTHLRAFAYILQYLMQRLALLVLAILCDTLAAAIGALPWFQINMRWDGLTIPNAGMYLQIGLTVLAVGLCFFLHQIAV